MHSSQHVHWPVTSSFRASKTDVAYTSQGAHQSKQSSDNIDKYSEGHEHPHPEKYSVSLGTQFRLSFPIISGQEGTTMWWFSLSDLKTTKNVNECISITSFRCGCLSTKYFPHLSYLWSCNIMILICSFAENMRRSCLEWTLEATIQQTLIIC